MKGRRGDAAGQEGTETLHGRIGAASGKARQPCMTYDFIHDRTEGGQPLRMLTMEDEYMREGLTVAVGRSIPAKRVKEILMVLFDERGAPEYL